MELWKTGPVALFSSSTIPHFSNEIPGGSVMRLRANEFCPIHKSISCCGREFIPKPRTIRPGIQRVEDPHHPRGYRELRSQAEMRKLLKRKIVEQDKNVPSATKNSPTTTTLCRITRIPKGWEGLGETTIQTTFEQRIGGAIQRRDQPEWMTDGRSAD